MQVFAAQRRPVWACGRARRMDGHSQKPSRRIQRARVLGFVPQAAGREHVLTARQARAGSWQRSSVVDDVQRPAVAIGIAKHRGEGMAGRNDGVRGGKAARHRLRAPREVRGQGAPAYGIPPRGNAGMHDGHDRRRPIGQPRIGGRVQVNAVGPDRAGDRGERSCGLAQRRRGLGRPVERMIRVDQGGRHRFALLRRRTRAEGCDRHRNAAPLQPVGEIGDIGPHAAYGVGREQQVAGGGGGQASCSRAASGSGACSWMSLKRAKRER